MWGLPAARVGILAAAVLAAFVAGGFSTWFGLASPRILEAHTRGQAALNALRADYSDRLAKGERAARNALAAEQGKAQEADREYQQTIERINREAAARPPRVVRVQCPPASPGSAPADRAAGDPGGAAGPAPDRDGVAAVVPSSGVDLDLSGYDKVEARVIIESAKLRALQERCGG